MLTLQIIQGRERIMEVYHREIEKRCLESLCIRKFFEFHEFINIQ